MIKKPVSLNLETDKVKQLDLLIQTPVSRSDIVNDILGYLLQSPDTIKHFVSVRQQQITELLSVNNE
jgi:hypothetical protein